MGFEYILEAEAKPQKLSREQENDIVAHISDNYIQWDSQRSVQKDIYLALKPEIYLEERAKTNSWKSQKKLNKIYSLFQTRQAHLWENLYSDMKRMFDVDGKTEAADRAAPAQKEALIDAFDKMKVTHQLDKAVEWLDSVGEFCLFVGWKKIYRNVRRPLQQTTALSFDKASPYDAATSSDTAALFDSPASLTAPRFQGVQGTSPSGTDVTTGARGVTGAPLKLKKKGALSGIYEELVYDGAYVEALNPLNLVFDPSVRPEIEDEWRRGGKIVKTFKTYNQIASNKIYRLSKDQLADIKNAILTQKIDDVKDDAALTGDVFDQDKIEVLEYWGDYVLDGKTLKNYAIAVIGRKYLARFIENPFIINPLINAAIIRHPDTKRGIPCLYSVLDIAKAQEEDVNEVKDVQQLNKNPARYAPEGLFKKTKTEIEPGLILEYKKGVEEPNAIMPVSVPLMNADTQIQFMDRIISEISGIFPNMQGQEEHKNATATELKIKVSGQTTRLSKDIDTIKQNGIIKMVEKVADLLANEKNGTAERLLFRQNGRLQNVVVTDAVRQGAYEYKYTDGSSLAVKKSQFNEAIALFKAAASLPDIATALDWKEVLVYGLQVIGLENTDKFFKPQAPVNPQMSNLAAPGGLVQTMAGGNAQGGALMTQGTGVQGMPGQNQGAGVQGMPGQNQGAGVQGIPGAQAGAQAYLNPQGEDMTQNAAGFENQGQGDPRQVLAQALLRMQGR